MKTEKREITIALDLDATLRAVYAESACLAWMGDEKERPEELTADNRPLLAEFVRKALFRLATAVAPVVDAEAAVDAIERTTLPLLLPPDSRADAGRLRVLAEAYVAASVLADCYHLRPAIADRYADERRRSLSAFRLAVAGPLLRPARRV